MPPLPLSIPIVTKNEEANLERCLRSVAGLAAEIIIMDSGSTDGTAAVAQRHGARWLTQEWLGYRDQKNAVLRHCMQPWVLALDADEEVSPALRDEILSFFATKKSDHFHGLSFPRKVWFLGRWIMHGDWYPDRKLRLVRREGATWGGSIEHDKMVPTGPVLDARHDLHHYSFPSMSRYVEKINVFADAYLERQLASGQRFSALGCVMRSGWRFIRAYIFKRGFLDGFPGLWIAWSTAYQTFVRHSRLYEHEQQKPR
jgi:glycosyltransferase involved in cell wall biosynthesis